jgi:hypothetical protein
MFANMGRLFEKIIQIFVLIEAWLVPSGFATRIRAHTDEYIRRTVTDTG